VTDLSTLVAEPWADWGLLDCGNGQKLERYGPVAVVRPEPQAMWAPARDDWDPDATFVPGSDDEGGGRWVQHRSVPKQWELSRGAVRFHASLTPFRHLGFFPDMAPQGDWMRERSADADVLNLFGYTGVGTLLLSDSGARLVHVDASKKSVEQGKANAVLSNMADRPIRWIVDDAPDFTEREGRRGRRYDGFVIDPPSYGHGPRGSRWDLADSLPDLLDACAAVATDDAVVLLTAHTTGLDANDLADALIDAFEPAPGIEVAAESIEETARSGAVLPLGVAARMIRG
jgi:23S rRNA (cytosine1962-C5)-methyltransferase